MPLTNLNLLDPATEYLNDRNNILKRWENDPLFQHSQTNTVTQQDLSAHQDLRGFVAIGYGLDLLHNKPTSDRRLFCGSEYSICGAF